MLNFDLILVSLMPVMVVVAALSDVTTMKIPNRLNMAIVVGYYPAAFLLGLELSVIGFSTLYAALLLVVGMMLFALRWLGGGDAKLLAAVALWMGPQALLTFCLYSALVGGLFCLLLMSARFWLQAYRPRLAKWAQRLLEPKGDVPYGVAIAAGALLAYPGSDLMYKFIGS